jgi:hypothetical protein
VDGDGLITQMDIREWSGVPMSIQQRIADIPAAEAAAITAIRVMAVTWVAWRERTTSDR